MKVLIPLLLAALPAIQAGAQTTGHGHGHGHGHAAAHPAPTTVAAPAAGESTAGEVRRIDKAARKITLRHEHVKNLDMPPMTMVFQVRDAALLDKVKVGDAVRFTVDRIDGAYVVLSLEPAQK